MHWKFVKAAAVVTNAESLYLFVASDRDPSMISSLPSSLIDSIPSVLLADAQRWWFSLSDSDRSELKMLCDSRREIFLFETFSGDDDSPKVTGGKFIPHDHAFGINDWGEDYFQHLLDHPELMIVYDPELRTFHIGCSRHITARRCFAEGMVSDQFRCPFDSPECVMHKIVNNRPCMEIRPISKEHALIFRNRFLN